MHNYRPQPNYELSIMNYELKRNNNKHRKNQKQ